MANLLRNTYLQQKAREFKDLDSIKRLLYSHGFLLSHDAS
jgi:hypothetical protein